jgi:hypothetical protein
LTISFREDLNRKDPPIVELQENHDHSADRASYWGHSWTNWRMCIFIEWFTKYTLYEISLPAEIIRFYKPLDENADSSICCNFDPVSNVNDLRYY